MSRLIVKNLPNNVTTDKLRDIFSEKGEITDVQLKYTKEGKFRNFGFIGFKTEDQATLAKEFFNGSCIKTTRIVVETCVSLGNTDKPQAWSKYAPDSSAYRKSHPVLDPTESSSKEGTEKILTKEQRKKLKNKEKNNKIREILQKHKDDPMFSEYMEVHASKLDKAVWGNDAIINKRRPKGDQHSNGKEEKGGDSGVEEEEDRVSEPEEVDKNEKKKIADEAISDLEYMKKIMKKKMKKVEEEIEEESANEDGKKAEKKPKKKKEPRNRLLFYIKIQGMPFSCKKKDVKEFFRPLVPFTIRIPRCIGKVTRGFCYVGFRSEEEKKKALFKNKSFLAGHRVIVNSYENKSLPDDDQPEATTFKRKNQEESLKNEESIAESGRIYVRNLPYITTENELQELFEKFGPVTEANLPVDKLTHTPKGFGHITFMMPEHAVKAFIQLDGSVFCGRMLHLLPGKQKEELDPNEEGLTYKQKKERKQKQQAGSAHNWNTLFLGANAIADVVANTYNTTKEKFLEGNAKTSAAVRLALGETQLVAGTKKFLEDNGVCLDAFNQVAKKRSKTVILVKNMPAQSTYDEVLKLFEPFGLIARIVMPPHGITALIEFVEAMEARKAFSKLAYSKFKYLPLYLEWAPDNVFLKPADPSEKIEPSVMKEDSKQTIVNDLGKGKKKKRNAKEEEKVKEEPAKPKEEERNEEPEIEDDEEPEPDTILFVKGLDFETRDDALREHFAGCGRLYSATVALKKDPHHPGQQLSMGYGFVHFYTKVAIEKALRNLQMSSLDGRQIELKRSERTGRGDVKTAKKQTQNKKQTGTKILVRNVPFQANQREIQEIFSTFGEIKSLRMPKKMQPGESQHRGFCFVEYYNNGDAKSAFDALCQSTHLYGRRLVLEWAQLEDDNEFLETLRKRTAQSYNQAKPGGKKTRKALLEPEGMEEEEED